MHVTHTRHYSIRTHQTWEANVPNNHPDLAAALNGYGSSTLDELICSTGTLIHQEQDEDDELFDTETEPSTALEIITIRDPDGDTDVIAFQNGERVTFTDYSVDVGVGWTPEEWHELQQTYAATASPAATDALADIMGEAAKGSDYIEGDTLWFLRSADHHVLHLGYLADEYVATPPTDPELIDLPLRLLLPNLSGVIIDTGPWHLWAEPDPHGAGQSLHLAAYYQGPPPPTEEIARLRDYLTNVLEDRLPGGRLADVMYLTTSTWSEDLGTWTANTADPNGYNWTPATEATA